MASRLIKLEDGTLVEVEVPGDEVQQISGNMAETVEATLGKIKPVLLKACKPIADAVKELRTEVDLDQVEIELGLGFEVEGNLYITKATANANLVVRMTLRNR